MLSDEEKKALKELTEIKELVEEDLKYKDYEVAATLDQIDLESLVIVLNLIEKQSKEIEHQKEKRENQKKELAILNAKQIEFNKLVNTVNSYKGQFKRQQKEIEELKDMNERQKYRIELVSEDKIEERGDSIDESTMLKQIKSKLDEKNIPIETLLAEFERLEDLEDDLTTVYLNGFYDGEKKVKDKIKAKIEEYKKDGKIINQTMPYCGEYINHFEIKALQSLLEKEFPTTITKEELEKRWKE